MPALQFVSQYQQCSRTQRTLYLIVCLRQRHHVFVCARRLSVISPFLCRDVPGVYTRRKQLGSKPIFHAAVRTLV